MSAIEKANSCETQLSSLFQDISLNYDNNTQTDLISLDFAKAFDTIPHQRLLYKLQWYGIHTPMDKSILTEQIPTSSP